MTVYTVIDENRHNDVGVYLFSQVQRAIDCAQNIANANGTNREAIDEDERFMSEADLADAGWLYYERYSPEGDCVHVEALNIDDETIAQG